MDINGYVDRVNYHLERLGLESRPLMDVYVEAWNNQMPARKMAETYKRRFHRSQSTDDESEARPSDH